MKLRLKRLTSLIAVLTLIVTAAPVAAGAQADSTAGNSDAVSRLWGQDRYATSLAVAEAIAADAGGELSTAVLVSGGSWIDAVTAAPLAGSLGAPVLLASSRNGVTDATKAFMERVGVNRIVAIGSTTSLPSAALNELSDIDSDIERITAADKYAASVAVAEAMGTPARLGSGYGQTVILASGEVFADALSAGPLGALKGIPILLTTPDELHPAVESYITENADHVIIMGGNAAIKPVVQRAVNEIHMATKPKDTLAIRRIGGVDRFETAILFAEFLESLYTDRLCFDRTRAGLATGGVPADAFSSAPLLARLCAPLVLTYTSELPESTDVWLRYTENLWVFGGTAAVSDAAVSQWTPHDPDSTGARLASQLFRFDHEHIKTLFPECTAGQTGINGPQTQFFYGRWDDMFAVWDREAIEITDRETGSREVIASGWWTDRQLQAYYPGSDMTADNAASRFIFSSNPDELGTDSSVSVTAWYAKPSDFRSLNSAVRSRGWTDSTVHRSKLNIGRWVTETGIGGADAPWPSDVNLGALLAGWTRVRYQYPPLRGEPSAFAVTTLLTVTSGSCVMAEMQQACEVRSNTGRVPEEPYLQPDHPLGIVLWNLACPVPA